MKNYAFIFARGGSKGLPKKNIKPLAGKPLILYSIETAFSSPSIDKVFVSTEDKDIADVAVKSGAILIERPAELATDTSPEWLSWQHAINWVEKKYGAFKSFVSLPATSPLRSVGDVEAAIEKLDQTGADICISVTPANRNPYFNMVKSSDNEFVELVCKPDSSVSRRQDAPEVFDITTVVYAAKPTFILTQSSLFEGRVTSIEVPKSRAADIDDIYDFLMAETMLGESNK